MKIAQITTDSREHFQDYSRPDPYFGTAPQALIEGFANLPDLELHVISCARKPMKSPEKLADNIWFHGVYVPRIGWTSTCFQGCVRATRRTLKAIQPDLVHGQGTERDCALDAVFSRFPNVLTIHGNMAELARLFKASMASYGWLAAELENTALKRTGGVFCNSAYTENLVKPRTAKTWRVPNAIRQIFFDTPPAAPKPDKCLLLNIGVISERKRQLELLAVAHKLHEHGLNFEIQFIGDLGESPYCLTFRERLKEAETLGYARHLGRKTSEELIAALDAAHGLVHFPSEEAFGLVVAEALSRNLRFFGARLGGMVDICDSVPGAELFAAEDWDGLTNALANWIQGGHSRSPGAAEIMKARYHPRVIAQRHVEIYREILANTRPNIH